MASVFCMCHLVLPLASGPRPHGQTYVIFIHDLCSSSPSGCLMLPAAHVESEEAQVNPDTLAITAWSPLTGSLECYCGRSFPPINRHTKRVCSVLQTSPPRVKETPGVSTERSITPSPRPPVVYTLNKCLFWMGNGRSVSYSKDGDPMSWRRSPPRSHFRTRLRARCVASDAYRRDQSQTVEQADGNGVFRG